MMRKFRVAAIACGLLAYSMSATAAMKGMSEPGMYNLTIGGLAGRDDAKGIDEKFREINGVDKVHVDFKNGMVMVWVKKGYQLDQGLAQNIVKEAGFILKDFEAPK